MPRRRHSLPVVAEASTTETGKEADGDEGDEQERHRSRRRENQQRAGSERTDPGQERPNPCVQETASGWLLNAGANGAGHYPNDAKYAETEGEVEETEESGGFPEKCRIQFLTRCLC